MKKLLVLLLLAGLMAGCGEEKGAPGAGKEQAEALPVAVRTAVAERQDIREVLEFTGDVESPLSVEVCAKASGRLETLELRRGKGKGQKAIPVEEGVEVRKGEILGEVDHALLEAQVAVAGAQVQAAEVQLEDKDRENRRKESLYKEDVATQQQRDAAETAFKSAQASLAQAQAQLRLARVNLEEAFVRAPMDGVVVKRYVDPGAMVGSSAPVVRLAQLDPLRLMLAVPSRMLPLLKAGETPVEVRLEGAGERPFDCTVSRIFPSVDPATRTATVEVLLGNPADAEGRRAAWPGMYATASVSLQSKTGALTVPSEAVVRVLERQVLFVVGGDGRAAARDVVTGIRSGGRVEIVSGLAEGEEYVVMGQNKLTDGARVERVGDADGGVAAP